MSVYRSKGYEVHAWISGPINIGEYLLRIYVNSLPYLHIYHSSYELLEPIKDSLDSLDIHEFTEYVEVMELVVNDLVVRPAQHIRATTLKNVLNARVRDDF